MQDQKNTTSTPNPADDATSAANAAIGLATQSDFVKKIVDKINSSENILIALSRDPSVDEIAAAIGLTLYLDSIQKHATAIYSGRTPDALKFLQPDATFESTTDGLQDFIIALNKSKADHLRYKLEGDFVKIFITPYRDPITKDDLSFSYGDYNVNFVIAINVSSANNLDEALREHGRIMHDASAVNITTGEPGRFGEIEWSNPTASSLCEMVADLIFALQDSDTAPLDQDIATALLTGIVAATDRFSNSHTNSDTLSIASKLMSMGANQQLITSNIQGNEIIHNDEASSKTTAKPVEDETNLTVDHDAPASTPEPTPATPNPTPTVNPAATSAPAAQTANTPAPANAISDTNSVTPENVTVQPVIPAPIDQMQIPNLPPAAPTPTPTAAPITEMQLPGVAPNPHALATTPPTTPNQPSVGVSLQPPAPTRPKNYAEMMEEALAEPDPSLVNSANNFADPTPAMPSLPVVDSSTMSLPPTPTPMEPIANPTAPILPPPPNPLDANGMMPPVLPPVQTTPGN